METIKAVWGEIDWFWFVIATALSLCVGAIWYSSKVFLKDWIEVFKLKLPAKPNSWEMIYPILMQIIATAGFGILYFIITPVSLSLALIVSAAFLLWQLSALIFRYRNTKTLMKAIKLEIGYPFLVMAISIIFALL